MITNLNQLADTLQNARTPRDVFGDLPGVYGAQIAELARRHRKLLQLAHPDRNPADIKRAEQLFSDLQRWHAAADKQIRAGVYGKRAENPLFSLTLRTGRYDIFGPLVTTDCYAVYRCVPANPAPAGTLRIKIIRDPQNNDLARREADLLRPLADDARVRRYFPKLVEAFTLREAGAARQALIIAVPADLISLADLRRAFPAGLDPRDAAWIFNRILEALYYAHARGVIHANINSQTLAVTLANHGLTVDEWPLAVPVDAPLIAVPPSYAGWYAEIPAHRATPALDITLALRTLVDLLGGNPLTAELPITIPAALKRFIEGALLLPHAGRPNDAGALRHEFDELLQTLYGPRTFRALTIPTAQAKT
ncbi:MAG TPA: hypothetical protein VHM90_22935 [Phycisphaerae bacterium]|nr:hypothetical protein [Phycisphaerae bacterium]